MSSSPTTADAPANGGCSWGWIAALFMLAVLVGVGAGIAQRAGLVWLGLTAVVSGTAVTAGGVTIRSLLGCAGRAKVLRWFAVGALVATLAQHSCLYVGYRYDWHAVRDREPALRLFRDEPEPMGPWAYLCREATAQRLAVWAIDASICCGTALCLAKRSIRSNPEGKE